MNTSIRNLKLYARQTLSGRYKVAVYAMLAVMGVTFLGDTLTTVLFHGSAPVTLITGEIFSFVIVQIMNVFLAGLGYLYLNMARGKEYSYGDLISLFKHNPDRVLVASLVLSVIDLLTSIPYYYTVYFVDPGTTLEAQAVWWMDVAARMLISIIVAEALKLPFAAAYFLLADNTELSGLEALKLSVRLMKGHKLKYVGLMLSFIPWLILSMFTLGIGILFLEPYMKMSAVMFYRSIIGEFDRAEIEQTIEVENAVTDDFNSEA